MFKRKKSRRVDEPAGCEPAGSDSVEAAAEALVKQAQATRRFGPVVAVQFLGLIEQNLRGLEVVPRGQMKQFTVLVATVAGQTSMPRPTTKKTNKNSPESRTACGTVGLAVGGSALARGPLGDLLLRVMVAYGGIMDVACERRFGGIPRSASRIPFPRHASAVSERTRLAVCRFPSVPGDGVGATHFDGPGEGLKGLGSIVAGGEPDLVRAVSAEQPLAARIYPAGWSLNEAELLDMTQDERLSRDLATTPAI